MSTLPPPVLALLLPVGLSPWRWGSCRQSPKICAGSSMGYAGRGFGILSFPPNTGKPICPIGLPGYCPPGWKEINYGSAFFIGFLPSRLQLPQRQQHILFPSEALGFPLRPQLGLGRKEYSPPRWDKFGCLLGGLFGEDSRDFHCRYQAKR